MNFVSISYFPGSIRNLKGFLLTLEGKSFDTFGVFVCIIIELTQLKEDQISALLNVSIVGNVRHDHVLKGINSYKVVQHDLDITLCLKQFPFFYVFQLGTVRLVVLKYIYSRSWLINILGR